MIARDDCSTCLPPLLYRPATHVIGLFQLCLFLSLGFGSVGAWFGSVMLQNDNSRHFCRRVSLTYEHHIWFTFVLFCCILGDCVFIIGLSYTISIFFMSSNLYVVLSGAMREWQMLSLKTSVTICNPLLTKCRAGAIGNCETVLR